MKCLKMLMLGLIIVSFAVTAQAGTLDEVKARGNLIIGVNGGVFGFSMPNDKGES